MKLTIPKCPDCGEPADGIHETVTGRAQISVDDDGNWIYAGETEIFWDDQRPVYDDGTTISLLCPEGHEWLSNYTGELV